METIFPNGDRKKSDIGDLTITETPLPFLDNSSNNGGGSGGGSSACNQLSMVGLLAGMAERTVANDLFIVGKNMKLHLTGRGLNKWTGSKAAAFKSVRLLNLAGKLAFFAKFGMAFYDLRTDFNWDKFGTYSYDLSTDALGTFGGGFGLLFSLDIQANVMYANFKANELTQLLNNCNSEQGVNEQIEIYKRNDFMYFNPEMP